MTVDQSILTLGNTHRHVVPLVLMTVQRHLQQKMVMDIPADHPTRADVVKVGRFQGNPLNSNVTIAIGSGDYEDPNYLDGRVDVPETGNYVLKNLPVGEIGGGTYWWRKFTVHYQLFFVRQKYEEDVALEMAYEFYSRLLDALENVNLSSSQVTDSSEGLIPPLYIEGSTFNESGGKDKFIWRGKVRCRLLTWRQ